jgi:AcrR family transcriptional regulator
VASGLRERKKLQTWREIRAAALRLFDQRGFETVSVDDIAEAAGVSRAIFFNYFRGKDAVVFDPDPEQTERSCQRMAARPAGEPLWAAISAVIVGFTEDIADVMVVQKRSCAASPALAEKNGRWLVVELTPPDFVQVFAPAGPPPPGPPRGSAGADDAARLFLRGYLPWLYGQAPLRAITAATSGLLADLKAHPPRIPPTMQALRPKVVAIAMQRRAHGWQAFPNISDGHETYELVLTIAQTRGRWLVSNVSSPR